MNESTDTQRKIDFEFENGFKIVEVDWKDALKEMENVFGRIPPMMPLNDRQYSLLKDPENTTLVFIEVRHGNYLKFGGNLFARNGAFFDSSQGAVSAILGRTRDPNPLPLEYAKLLQAWVKARGYDLRGLEEIRNIRMVTYRGNYFDVESSDGIPEGYEHYNDLDLSGLDISKLPEKMRIHGRTLNISNCKKLTKYPDQVVLNTTYTIQREEGPLPGYERTDEPEIKPSIKIAGSGISPQFPSRSVPLNPSSGLDGLART
jgi:hypothetical protein